MHLIVSCLFSFRFRFRLRYADCSQGKQRTVPRQCAGEKMKITLNACMDSKKRNADFRLSRKRNDEKVLERNLISIRTRRKMTFTQRASMPNESEKKRELRNKKGLLWMDVIFWPRGMQLILCLFVAKSTEHDMIDWSFVRTIQMIDFCVGIILVLYNTKLRKDFNTRFEEQCKKCSLPAIRSK